MTDRPILFSGPMVNALRAGNKTQTRRILKPQPGGTGQFDDIKSAKKALRIVPGDRLWVREAAIDLTAFMDAPLFKDRVSPFAYKADGDFIGCHRWRPGIHMPRKLSRITLLVTAVRVERLQDISEDDAWTEGCSRGLPDDIGGFFPAEEPDPSGIGMRGWDSARDWYADLWDAINGDGSWDENPWIAAYTFTVEPRNIDAEPARAA